MGVLTIQSDLQRDTVEVGGLLDRSDVFLPDMKLKSHDDIESDKIK